MGRSNYMAFKVLCLLLYGRYSSVVWGDAGVVRIRTRKFAKLIGGGMDSTRLRMCCLWLEEHGYATELAVDYGYITMRVRAPGSLARWEAA